MCFLVSAEQLFPENNFLLVRAVPPWKRSSHEIASRVGITLFPLPPEPHSRSGTPHPGGFLKFVLLPWWEEDACYFQAGEMLQSVSCKNERKTSLTCALLRQQLSEK